jgi:membrane protein DedA with SNARE-associated domain
MFETIPLTEQFPYFGLLGLLILGTLGFPFPEDSILLLSGFLAAQNYIKPLQGFLAVYSGLLLTDFLLYSVGQKYGRRVVEHKRFQKILTAKKLAKLEEKFRRWGSLVVFFGRHLLGLRAQIFLVAGALKMPWKRFMIVDAASALFTIALWGGLGYVGGNHVETLRRKITSIEFTLTVFLAILIGSVLFSRYLKK